MGTNDIGNTHVERGVKSDPLLAIAMRAQLDIDIAESDNPHDHEATAIADGHDEAGLTIPLAIIDDGGTHVQGHPIHTGLVEIVEETGTITHLRHHRCGNSVDDGDDGIKHEMSTEGNSHNPNTAPYVDEKVLLEAAHLGISPITTGIGEEHQHSDHMPASTDLMLSNDDDTIDSMLTDDNMPITIPLGFACTADGDLHANPGINGGQQVPVSAIVVMEIMLDGIHDHVIMRATISIDEMTVTAMGDHAGEFTNSTTVVEDVDGWCANGNGLGVDTEECLASDPYHLIHTIDGGNVFLSMSVITLVDGGEID